jgi:hypothetical protein
VIYEHKEMLMGDHPSSATSPSNTPKAFTTAAASVNALEFPLPLLHP